MGTSAGSLREKNVNPTTTGHVPTTNVGPHDSTMRYEGKLYRPPSEADACILQATIGCSWNHCTYCDMYRDKTFRVRELAATLEDLDAAGRNHGHLVEVHRLSKLVREPQELAWLRCIERNASQSVERNAD